jgi:hypothetical protein
MTVIVTGLGQNAATNLLQDRGSLIAVRWSLIAVRWSLVSSR